MYLPTKNKKVTTTTKTTEMGEVFVKSFPSSEEPENKMH